MNENAMLPDRQSRLRSEASLTFQESRFPARSLP